MRVLLHPRAEVEILEAAEDYLGVSSDLGADFRRELEAAIRFIVERAEACPVVVADVRRKLLRRFPYSVFFTVKDREIHVWAVAHQRRRPRYWAGRLAR